MSKVNIKRLNELLEKAKQKNKPKSLRSGKTKPIKGDLQDKQTTTQNRYLFVITLIRDRWQRVKSDVVDLRLPPQQRAERIREHLSVVLLLAIVRLK